MSHLREENISRVWREVPKDSFTRTLSGENTRMISWCKSCKEHKPLTSFYLKIKKERRHANDVRPNCIPCHDEQVDKARIARMMAAKSKLDKIFINEESENYGPLFVGGEVSSPND
jgi:hypothetical protein